MKNKIINTTDFLLKYTEQQIKPCPFCGNYDIGIKKSARKIGNANIQTWAYCKRCGATGRPAEFDFRIEQSSRKDWLIEYAFLYWNQRI